MNSGFTSTQKREIAGRARTLHERLEHHSNVPGRDSNVDPDRLLEEWRSVFTDESSFRKRLEQEGLSEETIREHVRATRWPSNERLPDWIGTLEEILRYVEAGAHRDEIPEISDPSSKVAFEELLVPVVEYARRQLDERIVCMELLSSVEQWLLKRLGTVSTRVLYVEFQSYLNHHEPDLLDVDADEFDEPTTTYYEQFVDAMFEHGFRNLCLEYPVLSRFIARLVEQWIDAVTELCSRIETDRDELREQFGVGGAVTGLEPLADDAHANGRIPVRVAFESGAVVYKPRDVSCGEIFYTIVDQVNERTSVQSYDSPEFLPRDGYGWMGYVGYEDAPDAAAIEDYYERAGMLLALCYALSLNDCQFENVVAAGDTPIIVDGETLFHPWTPPANRPFESAIPAVITRSVLWTALLPMATGRPRQQDGPGSHQLPPGFGDGSSIEFIPRPEIEAKNTDVMSVKKQPRTFDLQTNTPSVDGTNHPPEEHIDTLLSGFEETYETLRELRAEDALFSEIADPATIEDVTNRFLYNATATYMSVIQSMLARNPLRDGVWLTTRMEALVAPYFDGRVEGGEFWSIYEAERRALRRLDVPRFISRPDSETVFHDGAEIDTALTVKSGYEQSKQRVDEFSPRDLHRQKAIIRYCCRFPPGRRDAPPSSADPMDEAFQETATELFERAIDAAIELNGRNEWISTGPIETGLTLIPANESLYYGRGGLALTAAALYQVAGKERYCRLAEEIVEPVADQIRSGRSYDIGGTTGVGSVVYSFSVLADLLEDDEYRKLATTAARTVTSDRLAADETFDVMSGSAGALLGLLAHYDRYRESEVLDRALTCGDRLLEARTPVGGEGHRVWQTAEGVVFSGFGHGSAGIAYALARLGSSTGKRRYENAAREAVDFESILYDPDRCNWKREPNSETYQDRWCHGRSGMALSRIGLLTHLGDDRFRVEAQAALEATATGDPSVVDTLCCGNFGRVEALLAGANAGLNERSAAIRLANRCLTRQEQEGMLTLQGHSDAFVNPTLFNGLCGAAYTLLRIEKPDTLPSVLLFE